MASELTLPKQPIAIRPEHIAPGITTLRFQSTSWIGGEYAVSTFASDSQGSAMDAELTKLFVIDGNPASWSQHRYFRDASGLPLFELRRKPTGVTWFVEMPGGSSPPLATLAPRWGGLKDRCDVFVANAAAQGEEAMLEVRG